MHQRVGDVGMELQCEGVSSRNAWTGKSLPSASNSLPWGRVKPSRCSDRRGPATDAQRAAGVGRADRIIADLGPALVGAGRRWRRDAWRASAPRGRCRDRGRAPRNGTRSSRSRRGDRRRDRWRSSGRRRSPRRRDRRARPAADRRSAAFGCQAQAPSVRSALPTRPASMSPGAARSAPGRPSALRPDGNPALRQSRSGCRRIDIVCSCIACCADEVITRA